MTWSILLLACVPDADRVAVIDVGAELPEVDERFLSVAVDLGQVAGTVFWNPDASGDPEAPVEPYDFTRDRLHELAAPLAPAWLRIGGTEADRLYYETDEGVPDPLPDGFESALTREAWDGAGAFAEAVGFDLIFTLNAGPGPRPSGAWDPENARALLRWTAAKAWPVGAWELGNEPNGWPLLFGLNVTPAAWAEDLATLADLRDEEAPGALVVGPATAWWPLVGEFVEYLGPAVAAAERLDVVTWHYYPQQGERCPAATVPATPEALLDPARLDELAVWAEVVEGAAQVRSLPVWLGESGNAQCGGQPGVSDTWASSPWWADQLGQVAARGQQAVVRQTLSGSDYGLVDDVTLEPRPDWWVSLLWRREMGVVPVAVTGDDPWLRVYAHCRRDGEGLAVLGINLASTSVRLEGLRVREARVLEADGLDARTVRLNGVPLAVGPDGSPPDTPGVAVRHAVLPPHSIGWYRADGC